MCNFACAFLALSLGVQQGWVPTATAGGRPGAETAPIPAAASHQELVTRYCVRCHNDKLLRGGMSLEEFEVAAAHRDREVAEKMIRKLRAGMMPPRPGRQPDEAEIRALIAFLEHSLDEAAAQHPDPGRRTFQRLIRAEYARSIRDLLAIEVEAGAFLPPDTVSHGFDNIADVQALSPTLMEGYLRAAATVSRAALGDPRAGPSETTYKVPRTASQWQWVEGAPLGTRGGISVIHNFPADGEYVFKLMLHSTPTGQLFGSTARGEQIEVSIDGERVALLDIDPTMTESDPSGMTLETAPIVVRVGARRLSAAFLPRFSGPVDDLIAPIDHTLADTQIGLAQGVTTLPHLRDLTVSGPFGVTGVSDTPSRRLVFSCRPTAPDEEPPCARQIVERLATRAYRRPLSDLDLEGLMSFYDRGAARGGFEAGVRTALQAILASPHFVFRLERTPADVAPGESYPITDLELASRLSYFLWATAPDTELVRLGSEGRLSRPEILRAQVLRMLDDPRARALSTRFAAQWLRLQDLDKIHPDALAYPQFDHTLALAMRRETELLFDHLVREDKSVLQLLDADYTFLNERLARHYGITAVAGADFVRVELEGERRRGLLGHGSILTLTSHANRTSPVLRGKWVMEVLLGSPPPPPPPDVPDLEETSAVDAGRALSVRERLEQHRSNPACRSCHRVIDPIGLALENFDVTGAWRSRDNGVAVDPSGELYDGSALNGPADLRRALLERADVFLITFTENLLAYGIGRRVEYHDMPAVRAILSQAEGDGYRLSSFLLGVANSPPFRMSRAEAVESRAPTTESN